MNTFRTTFDINESESKIDYSSRTFFIGSCFTENIGNKMQELKFPVCINPFGILYNPLSIINSIHFLAAEKIFSENELLLNNGIWCSLHHHGRFSGTDKKKCIENINASCAAATDFIKKTDILFITFGTSYYYLHKEKNSIAANCHKFPSSHFEKKILDAETIVKEFKSLHNALLKINPEIRIVLTISPVRHINDGIVNNQLSKSILHVAVHKITGENKNCFYFPAYELQMDDLRDYRFYCSDMVHPGDVATAYIWEKFKETYVEKESRNILAEIEQLRAAVNHRSFHPGSAAAKEFRTAQAKKVKDFKIRFPFLDLREFENYFGNTVH